MTAPKAVAVIFGIVAFLLVFFSAAYYVERWGVVTPVNPLLPPPPPIQRAGGVPTPVAEGPCKKNEDLVAAPPGMPTRAGVVCLPRRR